MGQEQSNEFHDPMLKSAVKRAWGEQCCPDTLREQVRKTVVTANASKLSWPVWFTWGLAAAGIALAVTIPIYRHFANSSDRTVQVASSLRPFIPVSLQSDLIRTHDRCSKSKDHHHLPVPRDDDAAIAQCMSTQLSRAVLVARPVDPAWTFKGAAICHVGTVPCGHLVFVNGSESLSLFSLPLSADPNLAEGAKVQTVCDGHPMIAFVSHGALFCLVASGPLGSITIDDLSHMYDRMASHVTAAAPVQSTAVAELLYPVRP